jgi:hypothetical protein
MAEFSSKIDTINLKPPPLKTTKIKSYKYIYIYIFFNGDGGVGSQIWVGRVWEGIAIYLTVQYSNKKS